MISRELSFFLLCFQFLTMITTTTTISSHSPVIEEPHITSLSNHLSPPNNPYSLEHVTHILTTSLANHLLREKSIDGSVKVRILEYGILRLLER